MKNSVCKYGNYKMAVPIQYVAVKPSVCAVWAQNIKLANCESRRSPSEISFTGFVDEAALLWFKNLYFFIV